MDCGGEKRRMQVTFSGHVQGVGFRYAVCRIAEGYSVTGYVQNLGDGDVKLIAEGGEQELVAFHRAIQSSRLSRYIKHETLLWQAAKGAFETFEIFF